jgi:hypothetical protein
MSQQPNDNLEGEDNGVGIRWLCERDERGILLYQYRSDNPLMLRVFVKAYGQKTVIEVDHSKNVTGCK